MTDSEAQTAKLKQLHAKRGSVKAQLTSFDKFLKPINKDNFTPELKQNLIQRLLKIENHFDTFDDIQTEIEFIVIDTETYDKECMERESFCDMYFNLTSIAKVLLSPSNDSESHKGDEQNSIHNDHVSSYAESVSATHSRTKCSIKLPTIKLPSFSGAFTAWRSFFDSFNTLINSNEDLTNVQRLTYLKSALTGEPYDLISTLETTELNYEIALDMLKKRYDNKRRIVNNHILSILNLNSISRDSATQLKELINTIQTHINCLTSLAQAVDKWDAILVPIVISKLDTQTAREWETKLNIENSTNDTIPTLSELIQFLTSKLITLEMIGQSREPRTGAVKTSRTFTSLDSKPISCSNCGENHHIYNCESFLKLDEQAKNKQARKIRVCINCLRKGHFLNECKSTSTCRVCNKKHHTLLHLNNNKPNHTVTNSCTNQTVNQDNSNAEISICKSMQNVNSQTLLSTAIAHVTDQNGTVHKVRLLLDSASQSNFITKDLCDKLKLNLQTAHLNVTGISQGAIKLSEKTELSIKSRLNNFKFNVNCFVISQITSAIPAYTLNKHSIDVPPNIKLADPEYYISRPVDILLGAGIFWSLLSIGQINQNAAVLQKTKLGWVLGGELINEKFVKESKISCISLDELNDDLQNFWKIDEFLSNTKQLSPDDQYCETLFKTTTHRDEMGRFIVKIPFKSNLNEVGDSINVAKKRMKHLENRFEKDPCLKTKYTEFVNEYINLNHMSKITEETVDPGFYLPHHCVIKTASETTKLRVVFDGSCKPESGISINDAQFIGPSLQNDIFSIIAKFRLHKYALTADIAKMYRQVWVHPDDRKYQKIVWRENPHDEFTTYQLNTVTYGTTSAPFLAMRSLLQVALDNEADYPHEAEIIRTQFYVDDLITGSNDLQKLHEIKANISKILANSGFILRKFNSNIVELSDTPICEQETYNLTTKEQKTLGVCWNPGTDLFSYSYIPTPQNGITKRNILAITAQLYDPLGMLAPVIIIAKLILQELWQLKIQWDESVPMFLHTKWLKFRDKLPEINNIITPRYALTNNYNYVELHAFADASMKAYGTCIYLRSVNEQNDIKVTLLAAKSRVAPLKCVTLPRLELCAATLAAQLIDKFKRILQIDIHKVVYWSDSEITLNWIKSSPSKWKTYVANRVSEIQRLSNPDDWYHVRSAENAADIITRGSYPNELKSNTLWWIGPTWLSQPTFKLPTHFVQTPIMLPELKNTVQSFHITTSVSSFLVNEHSSLNRLKRVTAYCCRYFNNLKSTVNKQSRQIGPLTVEELDNAFNKLITLVQRETFVQDYQQLSQGCSVHRKSNLLSLATFLDQQQIIRVGGRLKQSEFNFDKKHPIVLPKHHKFTELILQNEHELLLHAGPKLMLCNVREKFWPISGLNLAKKIVKNCVRCSKIMSKPINPIMGELPQERTLAMYPFHSTGVDYAGPYLYKDRIGRGTKTAKCYICLFICFTTKSIHLELVTNLSTETFLLAFKRFIARRGKPLQVFSDNGTNIVGANNALSELGKFFTENKYDIQSKVSMQGIKWNFIPPRSPTFGGLWEAGVKNVKYHLKRILSNTVLTYEEFSTILTQVESVLNSRPLFPLTSDPNDLEPLTPAHFLIGRSFITIPDPNVTDSPDNRLTRYQLLQKLHGQFWNKWSTEYVHHLQQRTKWAADTQHVKLGSLVILKEANLPPSHWRLGRVTRLHPGADGVTRVVSVQCATGEIKRAVNQVCMLPIEI